MSKNFGSLIFLASILIVLGIVFLLTRHTTPIPATFERTPPPTQTRVDEEIRKTDAALRGIQRLVVAQNAASDDETPLADVLRELPPVLPKPSLSEPALSGYSVPITQRTDRMASTAGAAGTAGVAGTAGAAGTAGTAGVAGTAGTAGAEEEVPEPKLSLTYIAPDVRQAVVDDILVREGDTLANGARVVAIRDSRIFVRDEEGKRSEIKITGAATDEASDASANAKIGKTAPKVKP
ncbi:hypothetical protein AGMMS50289_14640 [Betaproteobacteria bacterium]|nr:hypothetical protein AGMMS50289_14640 [Betaproteobacteria bacterium]